LKEKDFTSFRKWVGESDGDANDFFRAMFDKCEEYMPKSSIPNLVMIIAKYQYQNTFVANPDINLTACLVEISAECQFK
jgi:hypothetical protein